MKSNTDKNIFNDELKNSDENVDLTQLQRNLSLSPEERLIEHQNALDLVFDLEQAGRRMREAVHEKSQ